MILKFKLPFIVAEQLHHSHGQTKQSSSFYTTNRKCKLFKQQWTVFNVTHRTDAFCDTIKQSKLENLWQAPCASAMPTITERR